MPNPPFSGSGNDLDLPIDPAAYVTEIEGNFTKCKQEIIDLHNRTTNITNTVSGLFGNGQLELNGDMQISRWLHLKASAYTIPGPGNVRAATTNFANLPSGTSLGYAGTTYTYHPTIMAGWFIANEMLTSDFGDEDVLLGNKSLRLQFAAAARTKNVANEDWPALYQPISAHCPVDRFAGKALTISIKYDCDINNSGNLYAVWDGGANGRVEMVDTNDLSSGTDQVAQMSITPDADATYFEIGVLYKNTSSFIMTVHSIYCSDVAARVASSNSYQFTEAIRDLTERYYVQTWEFIHDQFAYDLIAASTIYAAYALPSQLGSLPMPQGCPFQHPTNNPGHPTGTLYAHEFACESMASVGGVAGIPQWDSVLDTVNLVPDLHYREVNTGVPSLAADKRSNVGCFRSDLQVFYIPNAAVMAAGIIPMVPIMGWGEVIALYPPLF